MNFEKCIWSGIKGAGLGFLIGIILWLPSCVVGTVATAINLIPPGRPGERWDVANWVLWGCVIVGGVVSFLVEVSEESKAADKRAAALEAEREQQRRAEVARNQAANAEQQKIATDLIQATEDSIRTFEKLPDHLLDAESHLDQAERDFKDGAFAPFWDSVERAAVHLGRFDAGVESINQNTNRYRQLTSRYKGKPPTLPLTPESVKGMGAAKTTTERMGAIVRTGQRNFQFATIFEQRRTNQILIAGFTNLAQAIDQMGLKISNSIDDLGERVSELSVALSDSMSSIEDVLSDINRATVSVAEQVTVLNSTVQTSSEHQLKRHDRALEMLDNIQRRRIPLPRKLRDGAY
jgi:hypothetical protein